MDVKKKNPRLTKNSQNLRKNMTKEESHLWYDFLKYLPYTINRQKVIGKYIVDFYCAEAQIVIELDGSQHGLDGEWQKDYARDKYLESLGIEVIRYPNYEIKKHFDGVCNGILEIIKDKVKEKREV